LVVWADTTTILEERSSEPLAVGKTLSGSDICLYHGFAVSACYTGRLLSHKQVSGKHHECMQDEGTRAYVP
jgi:hypothetical protein